jgi:hypothetical protein
MLSVHRGSTDDCDPDFPSGFFDPNRTLMKQKERIIEQIGNLVVLLAPLTMQISDSSLVWNGTEYAQGKNRNSNPAASNWYHSLTVIADLLKVQECEISQGQLTYLRSVLFGGMGSLSDAVGFEMLESDVALNQFEEGLSKLYRILK